MLQKPMSSPEGVPPTPINEWETRISIDSMQLANNMHDMTEMSNTWDQNKWPVGQYGAAVGKEAGDSGAEADCEI